MGAVTDSTGSAVPGAADHPAAQAAAHPYYMAGVMPVGGYHILGQNESQLGFAVESIQPTGTPAEVGHAAGGVVTFKSGTN